MIDALLGWCTFLMEDPAGLFFLIAVLAILVGLLIVVIGHIRRY